MAANVPIEKIGRYKILGELGRGAMGVVYRAEDPTIGRQVALKTTRVDVEGMESEEILRRFRQEARAAGLLNHGNIVTIYDAGEQDGLFYIAMEFIEGTTLQSMLSERRVLPADLVIDVARQVCAGLDYAHTHGVIHRDVKPANIMITAEGTAKVMDFGIAKAGGNMTSTGQVLGTPSYMSPEQVKGHPLDGRSDLFSLGVILYESCTGQKPFTGDNVTTIIYKIVNEHPKPPRELEVSIHPGLSEVITRALAKPASERYQRGADLARDLTNYKSLARPEAGRTGDSQTVKLQAAVAAAAAAAAAPAPVTRAKAGAAAQTTPKPARLVPPRVPAAPGRGSRATLPALVGVIVLALGLAGVYGWRHRQANQPSEAAPTAAPAATPASPKARAPRPKPSNAASTSVPLAEESKPAAGTPSGNEAANGAQPAAAPAFGSASFNSNPDRASLSIDGHSDPRWLTPYAASKLSVGAHTVVISKAGYTSKTLTVHVTEGKAALVSATLWPVVATLAVSSNPAGAVILIDGKNSGKVTPAQIAVPAGNHKVALELAGYLPTESEIPVKAGDTYNYAPVLSRTEAHKGVLGKIFGRDEGDKVQVQIRTEPKGADVLLDGEKMAKQSPLRTPVQPGTHKLTIQKSGFQAIEKTITVKKGEPMEINERLQRQP